MTGVSQNCFYVYALCDPINEKPFYIGKGSGERYLHHLTGRDTKNKNKVEAIKNIRHRNLEPLVHFWLTDCSESDAFALEKALIEHYGRMLDGGILTNIYLSNKPHSVKGHKWSEATKQRVRENYSETRKKKIGDANRGRKASPEARAKMSANNHRRGFRGRHSEEAKIKMSRAKTGTTHAPLTEKHKAILANAQEKTFELSFQEQQPFTITNLKRFASENGLLYKSLHLAIRKGRSYKGWTGKEVVHL